MASLALLVPGLLLCSSVASAETMARPANSGSRELRIVKVGSGQEAFHVVSTIVAGPTESIVLDAQYKVSDGRRLADAIAATGTRLKAIVLSHADHDHYMGAMEVLHRFPGTPVYMSSSGLTDFMKRSPDDLAHERQRGGAEVPDSIFTPQVLPADVLLVDGYEIEVIDGLHGDVRGPVSTALWIPALQTVLAGDLVFEGIHPWLGDADSESRLAWRESLEKLAALKPLVVVPGHKRDLNTADSPAQIDFMLRYLDDYDSIMATASTPREVADTMTVKYPDLAIPGLMAYGAKMWFKQ